MSAPTFTEDELVTAMCLWEAWLDLDAVLRAENPDPRAFEAAQVAQDMEAGHGSFTVRAALVDLVKPCDDGWRAVGALTDDDAPVFDWEWCPRFLIDALANGMMRQALDNQYTSQKCGARLGDGKVT